MISNKDLLDRKHEDVDDCHQLFDQATRTSLNSLIKRITVCMKSTRKVARRPPATTYTAIPIGNKKLHATRFALVRAWIVAEAPRTRDPVTIWAHSKA